MALSLFLVCINHLIQTFEPVHISTYARRQMAMLQVIVLHNQTKKCKKATRCETVACRVFLSALERVARG
jgi:hypothetical protein